MDWQSLLREQFPAPKWAVPGLLCEGLNLLAGAPKLGKSWLSLGIAAAIANGEPALGGARSSAARSCTARWRTPAGACNAAVSRCSPPVRATPLYRWLLSKRINPYLGETELGKMTTGAIRQWRAERLKAGVSESVAARCYRLMRAVLNTAVEEDNILPRNPCRVRGADKGDRPNGRCSLLRKSSTAGRMPARFRAMVLLAAFASLRWGEVSALRRCDIAEDASWVRISRAFVESTEKGLFAGPPKSKAGARTLTLPTAVRADILGHLETYAEGSRDALVFTGENGGAVRRPNFNQRVKWTATVTKMGLTGLHFHDLRHAGNTWAAQAGTSTRDLMTRMGHDDMRAAIIYQHATNEADQAIAERLSRLVDQQARVVQPSATGRKRGPK